jgi:hypothetical protein
VGLIFACGGKSKKGIGIFPKGQVWVYGEAAAMKMLCPPEQNLHVPWRKMKGSEHLRLRARKKRRFAPPLLLFA